MYVIAKTLHKTVGELLEDMDSDEFFGWIEHLTRPQHEEKKEEDPSMQIKQMLRKTIPYGN